jgi:hypothetical protein
MQIIDRTSNTATVLRTRDGRNIHSGGNPRARRRTDIIDAIILHHTGFVSGRVERFDYIIANYAVMQDGRVLRLRDLEVALNSVATHQHAIDIEFEGDYASARDIRRGRSSALPPVAQLSAGRELVRHLQQRHGVRYIFAHSQFTNKNCPGPHIWYNVGEWAVRNAGFASRGRGSRNNLAEFRDDALAVSGIPKPAASR